MKDLPLTEHPFYKESPELRQLLADMRITDDVKQNHRRIRNASLRKKVRYDKDLLRIVAGLVILGGQ